MKRNDLHFSFRHDTRWVNEWTPYKKNICVNTSAYYYWKIIQNSEEINYTTLNALAKRARNWSHNTMS